MRTLLFSHGDCLFHDTGLGHPERPDRVRAVLHALNDDAFADLEHRDAPLADMKQLERVHPSDHVARTLAKVPGAGLAHLDGDTVVSPGSRDAALRAAGAVCAAVDAVVNTEAQAAFCAVRPPGHHAEPTRAMGFCLFNNIVIGARHAVARHGLRRVAIVDFDVHHGNGSEAVARLDPDLFYGSTHQWPFYPGTGGGEEPAAANIVNVCLPANAGSSEFRTAMTHTLIPALTDFAPELVMISAGFDAHRADPLANLNLTEDDYQWVTEQLVAVARSSCEGRIVSVLEGGYDLIALGRSAAAHVKALMDA